MRKYLVFLILVAIVFLPGCGSKAIKRDVSTPEKALIGHWRQFDEATGEQVGREFYFTGSVVWIVDDANGKSGYLNYSVASMNMETKDIILETSKGTYPGIIGRVQVLLTDNYRRGDALFIQEEGAQAGVLIFADSKTIPDGY